MKLKELGECIGDLISAGNDVLHVLDPGAETTKEQATVAMNFAKAALEVTILFNLIVENNADD